jgi:hypothetical protein
MVEKGICLCMMIAIRGSWTDNSSICCSIRTPNPGILIGERGMKRVMKLLTDWGNCARERDQLQG